MRNRGTLGEKWQSFFDPNYWGDSEWQQRHDLIDLQDTAENLRVKQAEMFAANAKLQKHVKDLTTTIGVLLQYLAEKGQIDMDTLWDRVASAIEASNPPARPVPEIQDPWHAQPAPAPEPHASAAPEANVVCPQCHATVPMSRTTITEKGTVCDRCAAA